MMCQETNCPENRGRLRLTKIRMELLILLIYS
jgi:hypothetical protein